MDNQGKVMITCKEATFLISKKQQDKLSLGEQLKLKMHLLMCKYCQRFLNQVSFITKGIKRMRKKIEKQSAGISLTAEQKERLRQKIDRAKK